MISLLEGPDEIPGDVVALVLHRLLVQLPRERAIAAVGEIALGWRVIQGPAGMMPPHQPAGAICCSPALKPETTKPTKSIKTKRRIVLNTQLGLL